MVLEREKVIGSHEVYIKRYMDTAGEKIIVEFKINDSMKELISKFAVTGAETVAFTMYEKVLKRHKIKSVLYNSLGWRHIYDIFFMPSMVEESKVKIDLRGIAEYNDMAGYFSIIREFVRSMEEIVRNVGVKISLNVKEREE